MVLLSVLSGSIMETKDLDHGIVSGTTSTCHRCPTAIDERRLVGSTLPNFVGIVVGDFDNDGLNDIIITTVHGFVGFALEYRPGNKVSLVCKLHLTRALVL